MRRRRDGHLIRAVSAGAGTTKGQEIMLTISLQSSDCGDYSGRGGRGGRGG